jgi:uncharacterized protein
MQQILKVIVGSQAHGLATPESDYDYRGVFVVPTSELLKIGGVTHQTSWLEGKEDDTSWEVGKFLLMATKCNPTILETFLAKTIPVPIQNALYGIDLQELFPYVWNSVDVKNAFVGYGLNQRKKFLDERDSRPHKYAVAYLRTLYQAVELLTTGTFTVRIADTEIGETLKRWKNKEYTPGEVIQICYDYERKVEEAFKQNPDKKTNMEPVNEFLLKVRKAFWEAK